ARPARRTDGLKIAVHRGHAQMGPGHTSVGQQENWPQGDIAEAGCGDHAVREAQSQGGKKRISVCVREEASPWPVSTTMRISHGIPRPRRNRNRLTPPVTAIAAP